MSSGIVTLLAMIGFAGILWWAYAPARRARFEQMARVPLDDEDHVDGAGR